MYLYLAIFVGGGLGSLARFGISSFITDNFRGINPLGTFIANILASLLLGIVLLVLHQRTPLHPNLKAMLATGFCGGFSTFSTFSYETFELLKTGNYLWAFANVIVSVGLALAILWFISRWN